MESSLLIYAVLVAFACNRVAEAAVTGWSNPVLAAPTGTGAATGRISETSGTGITLVALGAGTITYSVTTQDAGTPSIVWSATGGVITKTSGTLSYASKSTYVIVVTAVDTTSPSTGTATVTLTINSDPVLSGQIAVTIPDASAAGTVLTTLAATNKDSDTITYALTAVSATFEISATTGAITVKTGVTLASATLAGYSLIATATDSYATATTTIWVVVKTCSSAATGLTTSLLLVLSAIFTMFKFYYD